MAREEDKFASEVRQMFRTNEGQNVLREMELRYCRSIFDENGNKLAYNAGQSDLVMFLKELSEDGG